MKTLCSMDTDRLIVHVKTANIYKDIAKYNFLINKREITGLKYLYDSKAFIKYSNDMVDINKN